MIFLEDFFDFMKINLIINFAYSKIHFQNFQIKNIKRPYDFLKNFFQFRKNNFKINLFQFKSFTSFSEKFLIFIG